MFRMATWTVLAALLAAATAGAETAPRDGGTVRTCVIGGAVMTGLWPEICARFTAETGYEVVVVATGTRPRIAEPFRRGEADLLTMHSGDITTDLVADGYGAGMRPWARNDLVIAGPAADPAGVAGLKSGAEALRRIAATRSPFVDNRANGPREMAHRLWREAGVRPVGDWVVKDEAAADRDRIAFAADRGAYIIFGRMPLTYGKIDAGDMRILVGDDPTMRRPYVVMTANPAVFPEANVEGAEALADFLLSDGIQEFLLTFGLEPNGGRPPFYPVWPHGERVGR